MRGLSAGRAAGTRRAVTLGTRRGRAAGRAAARRAAPRVAREREAARAQARRLAGNVLVVGDSLEVLTSPYLQRYLPGAHLTINIHGGFSSIQIFRLFREAYDPSQSVIVFDAGTNDNPHYPQILAAQLRAVAQIVGDRCLVVPTIHGLVVDGLGSGAKNRVVEAFAASRPGTQTPDWAGAVAAHPDLLLPDHLHPNPRGADFRARLVAEGVRNCLALTASFPVPGR